MKYPVWPHSYDMIAGVREETWLSTSSGVGEGHGTHSSALAWKIPRTEEAGRLQSMGSRAESRTRLSDFPFTFHFYALEKDMATHSSVLARRIPGTEEPGGYSPWGHQGLDTTERELNTHTRKVLPQEHRWFLRRQNDRTLKEKLPGQ